jgi:hypothetical protein
MNRIVVWTIAGVLVAGTAAAIAVNAEHRGGALLSDDFGAKAANYIDICMNTIRSQCG